MGQAQLSGLGVPQGGPWPEACVLWGGRGVHRHPHTISKEAWGVRGGDKCCGSRQVGRGHSRLELGHGLQSHRPDALRSGGHVSSREVRGGGAGHGRRGPGLCSRRLTGSLSQGLWGPGACPGLRRGEEGLVQPQLALLGRTELATVPPPSWELT